MNARFFRISLTLILFATLCVFALPGAKKGNRHGDGPNFSGNNHAGYSQSFHGPQGYNHYSGHQGNRGPQGFNRWDNRRDLRFHLSFFRGHGYNNRWYYGYRVGTGHGPRY